MANQEQLLEALEDPDVNDEESIGFLDYHLSSLGEDESQKRSKENNTDKGTSIKEIFHNNNYNFHNNNYNVEIVVTNSDEIENNLKATKSAISASQPDETRIEERDQNEEKTENTSNMYL